MRSGAFIQRKIQQSLRADEVIKEFLGLTFKKKIAFRIADQSWTADLLRDAVAEIIIEGGG